MSQKRKKRDFNLDRHCFNYNECNMHLISDANLKLETNSDLFVAYRGCWGSTSNPLEQPVMQFQIECR